MSDKVKCEAGCGDNATVHCEDASYCDDCFAENISKHLQEFMGWRPCGHLIYREGCEVPAICLQRHGEEHDHG